ncbi:MAG: carbohydrate ABC transporter permease [Terrabacter sp.]
MAERPRRGTLERREARAAYVFIAPWIIGFLVFTAGPMVASLWLSFTDYSLVEPGKPVGLANYQQLVEDPRVAKSLANTFVYAALFVPLGTVVALALAVLLQKVGRAAGFFRTVFYLPVMTPAVAAGAMFLLLLNGQRGLVNQVLGWFGVTGPNWTPTPPGSSPRWRWSASGPWAAASSSTSPPSTTCRDSSTRPPCSTAPARSGASSASPCR